MSTVPQVCAHSCAHLFVCVLQYFVSFWIGDKTPFYDCVCVLVCVTIAALCPSLDWISYKTLFHVCERDLQRAKESVCVHVHMHVCGRGETDTNTTEVHRHVKFK